MPNLNTVIKEYVYCYLTKLEMTFSSSQVIAVYVSEIQISARNGKKRGRDTRYVLPFGETNYIRLLKSQYVRQTKKIYAWETLIWFGKGCVDTTRNFGHL